MTELSGFSPVAKLFNSVQPQSFQVPRSRDDGVAKAGGIFGGIWDAVEAGLSDNIKIEVLRFRPPDAPSFVMCRIIPVQLDGVAATPANPGGWVAIDDHGIRGMSNDDYAAQFTQNVPVEWAATTTAPVATLNDDSSVTLSFPQPTSANRPFTYTAAGDGTIGQFSTDGNGQVSAKITGLAAGDHSWTVTVNTQYPGVTATSVASNTITIPAQS